MAGGSDHARGPAVLRRGAAAFAAMCLIHVPNTTGSFGGVAARYVKLTIEKGWGSTPSVGLSEV